MRKRSGATRPRGVSVSRLPAAATSRRREAGRILKYRRAMSEDGESSMEARARAATDKEAMKEAMAELFSELPAFRALLEDKGRRDNPAGDGSSSRVSGHHSM